MDNKRWYLTQNWLTIYGSILHVCFFLQVLTQKPGNLTYLGELDGSGIGLCCSNIVFIAFETKIKTNLRVPVENP